jgi:predicted DsbA family dithiol-disulfide isomerase
LLAQMKQIAAEENLPFGDRTRTYNSRLAQELGKWAETQGRGDEFHHLAFRAYFADGSNIAEPDVLLALAEKSGLPAAEARSVLEERRYASAVDADWEHSRQMGITAVPTFLAGGRRLVGAQPYEKLRSLVTGATGRGMGFPA